MKVSRATSMRIRQLVQIADFIDGILLLFAGVLLIFVFGYLAIAVMVWAIEDGYCLLAGKEWRFVVVFLLAIGILMLRRLAARLTEKKIARM